MPRALVAFSVLGLACVQPKMVIIIAADAGGDVATQAPAPDSAVDVAADTAPARADVAVTPDAPPAPPIDATPPPDAPAMDVAPDRSTGWTGAQGTMIIAESKPFDLGSGRMEWSLAGGQKGYFYSGASMTTPELTIANVLPGMSACALPSFPYSGYKGLASVRELRDAASLTFTVAKPNVEFGSRMDACNMGLLVFKQGDRYGVIDFVSIDARGLTMRYWLGDVGVTDFSMAPL
jgi:hypothetical protein